MALIASGKITGICDGHLVFINYLYGSVLSMLYRTIPGIEWYSVLFIVFHTLSLSAISDILLREQRNIGLFCASLILLYAIEIRIILMLSFTTTAGLMATTGLLIIVYYGREKLWKALCGIACFAIASLIRFDAAMFSGLIVASFYPLIIMRQGFSGKILVYLIICLCLAMGCKMIDKDVYASDKQWKEYSDYNEIRGKINDNPNGVIAYSHLPRYITSEDMTLFNLFLQSAELFDAEKIQKIIDAIEENTTVKMKMGNIIPQLIPQKWVLLSVLFMTILAIYYCEDIKQRLAVVLAFGVFILSICFIAMNTNIKFRALLCAILPYVLVITTIIKIKKRYYYIAVAMLSILMITKLSKYNVDNALQENREEVVTVLRKHNYLFVDYLGQETNPLHVTDIYSPQIQYGWVCGIPNSNYISSYMDFVGGNKKAFVTNQSMYELLSSLIASSLWSHQKIRVVPHVIYKAEEVVAFHFICE